jgi:DNA-binding LacI/PurR family transcriptional regulator
MRTSRPNRIVLLLPDSAQLVQGHVLNGTAQTFREAGYAFDLVGAEGDPLLREERVVTLLADRQVAGILSMAPLPGIQKRLSELPGHAPVLVVEEFDDQMHQKGTLADGSAAGKIVEYLAGLGHRRMFHLAGPATWPAARNRQAAYEEAIKRHGVQSAGVAAGDWLRQSGYDLADEIVETGATAVFAANDRMALGAIRRLHECGLRVPDDISVFGWDDTPAGRFSIPSLSTVRAHREQQGRDAATDLLTLLRGEQIRRRRQTMLDLVIRESTGPAPR